MGNTASRRRSRRSQQSEQQGPQYAPPAMPPVPVPVLPQGGPGQYPRPPAQTAAPQRPTSSVHETTTVRNLVNLKKQTLKLSPRQGSPHILDISFLMDLVSDCRVSIFLMAKEDSGTGAITAQKVVCEGAVCKLGMNIEFPFEGMLDEQRSIDTSNYSTEEMNAAHVGNWQYPLMIRLETLADKSAAETHALAQRKASDVLEPWVQSQTTYIVLGETAPEADDDSRIVRQRIYVQGQFYLLQEIYGITEANQASSSDDDSSAHCVVCLTNRKNTTVLPCRHFCMCDECAKLLLKRTRTCPMCRLPISSVLNIQIKPAAAAAS